MPEPRRLKKSESLEIRLPYPTKQAFMARCRAEGRSASETLRDFIEARVEPARRTRRWGHWIAGGLLAAAMGAVALPSLARPGPQPDFRQLDANRDGFLSYAEYSARR
jgi:hypothetical protein